MNKTSVTQHAKTTSFLPLAQGQLQRKCACGNRTVSGGECPECAKKKNGLHRKLAIGASNDPLEQEADRVAEKVMAAPAHFAVSHVLPRIQCFTSQSNRQIDAVPASVDRALDSPSRQLEPGLRKEMEKSFGRDFSQVRLHTDGQAAISSQSIHALAYTLGRDIVFAPNQYSPQTENGRRLLAHELTHVVQQEAVGSSFVQTKPAMDQPRSPFEQEADFMADAVTRPQRSPQGRSMGGTLPYREATELLECIRIMGENSRDYCREVVLGEKPVPVEEAPKWTRKHTKGPRLLDGDKPSYQVWFNHIFPPVPTGVTQIWQVVESTMTFLTDKCELKTEKDFRIDIVDISARKKIEDSWGLIRTEAPCFAMEESNATVGFDDQKSNLVQQTNVKASENLAKDTLGKMAGPRGTYSGKYTFIKSKNCKDCPEKLMDIQEKNKAPNGEALSIEGVGSWKS